MKNNNSCQVHDLFLKMFILPLLILAGFFIFGQTALAEDVVIIEDTTWESGQVIIIDGSDGLAIMAGATLTINPGTVVKLAQDNGIMVMGNLIINGEEDNPVVITSIKDDSIGGDSNEDGSATTAAPGDWFSIIVNSADVGINISYAEIKYGGNYQGSPQMFIAAMNADEFKITNSSIINNNGMILVDHVDNFQINYSNIYNPDFCQTGDPFGMGVEITYCGGPAIMNMGSNPIDATNVYWGYEQGPTIIEQLNGPEDVKGTAIQGLVNYQPFLSGPWQLEPSEPEIDPLILQYEPILYLHPEETYQPMNVEAYVKHSSLWDSHGAAADDELLIPEDLNDPVILDDIATTTDSSSFYLQFNEPMITEFLQIRPDPVAAQNEYELMYENNEIKYTYYATKIIDKDEENNKEYIVLEYWYFYAFNDWKEKDGENNHEGDWECVMVFLDKATEQPKYIAYSSHYNKGQVEAPYLAQYASVRRSWDDPEVIKQGDYVISFVGVGSHANFPNNGHSGIHTIPFFPDDRTSYSGLHLDQDKWQNIVEFKEGNYPKWLTNYQGHWGVVVGAWGFDGCGHPYPSQYKRFTEPVKWAGVDKVGEVTVWEPGMAMLIFVEEKAELVFDQTLDIGTKVVVDLHNEIIELGSDLKEIVFLPHFWDITSNLINDTFEAEVSFEYDSEEIEAMGIKEKYLAVFLYDKDNKIWEKIPSVTDISNQVISFFTTHFSRYALGAELWQDISEEVKVNKGWEHYDCRTGIKHVNVRIKNKTKENITGDIRLIIKDINKEDVVLVNNTATTTEGYPYIEIKAKDLYNHCIFIGSEEDIPEDLNTKGLLKKSIKRKMVQKKPLKRKACEKIISKYPELEEKLEYMLLPHHYTQPIKLEFSLPIKKTKVHKKHGQEVIHYIPEFKNFRFEVNVLNKQF